MLETVILTLARCARNCFNCPICTSQMTVNTLTDAKEGPWILTCNYCMWTSLDIGIKFDKPTNIRSQLDKIANGGIPKPQPDAPRKSSLAREPFSPGSTQSEESSDQATTASPLLRDPTARFAALKAFYKSQITLSSESSSATDLATAAAYSSPSSLTRLVNLYTSHGISLSGRKSRTRTPAMREALTVSEGLFLSTDVPSPGPPTSDFGNLVSKAQRHFQQACGNPHARTISELRPIPTLLRTKRSKRCAACKHILVKPDFKPTSTRYRIKLIALNYIPLVTLKPLNPNSWSSSSSLPPISVSDDRADPVVPPLPPNKPTQFLLTLRNPLFDPVRVSLATPAETPGRLRHRVTVLCPQFEIGANSDVWDDTLGSGKGGGGRDGGMAGGMGSGVAEAGKVYERGRNSVAVVLEVVPASDAAAAMVLQKRTESKVREDGKVDSLDGETSRRCNEDDANDVPSEDDDVIEIPIRVRLEWRQADVEDAAGDGKKSKSSEKILEEGEGEHEDTARRELAYWMVLGIGRAGT